MKNKLVYIFYLFMLVHLTGYLHAQPGFEFNKRFVESEDRWVAFKKGKDSTQPYGFIYIDAQAGLTFNYEGNFTISPDGKLIPKKQEKSSVKIRLEANNVQVAWIPESRFDELAIKAVPDWLKYYKTDTSSVQHFYRWGFMYNGWGECEKALTYLRKADAIDANFKGLAVELAYSFNCLKQYDKAIEVLQSALVAAPADAYVNKELVFALAQSGDPDKAAVACEHAMEVCTDKTYEGENCYNVLHGYFQKGDKAGFNKWLSRTKKLTAGQKLFDDNIKMMEEKMQ